MDSKERAEIVQDIAKCMVDVDVTSVKLNNESVIFNWNSGSTEISSVAPQLPPSPDGEVFAKDYSIYCNREGRVVLWHIPCQSEAGYFDPDLHIDLKKVNVAAQYHRCNPAKEG